MAQAIPKVCSYPGCGKTSLGNRCPKHQAQLEAEKLARQKSEDGRRGNRHARGYGTRWQRERDDFLRDNPWCVDCEEEGNRVAATQVDHDIPCKKDDPQFWDRGNWRGRCRTHHSRKTAKFDGGFGNPVRDPSSRSGSSRGRGVGISRDRRPRYRAGPTNFTRSKLDRGG